MRKEGCFGWQHCSLWLLPYSIELRRTTQDSPWMQSYQQSIYSSSVARVRSVSCRRWRTELLLSRLSARGLLDLSTRLLSRYQLFAISVIAPLVCLRLVGWPHTTTLRVGTWTLTSSLNKQQHHQLALAGEVSRLWRNQCTFSFFRQHTLQSFYKRFGTSGSKIIVTLLCSSSYTPSQIITEYIYFF